VIDILIIGAGPAGSAAAIQLARGGQRVVVVDRQTFPRHKPCAGILTARTTRQLRALLGHTVPLPGTTGTRLTYVIGRHRLGCHTRGAMRVVRRDMFDLALANAAAAAGAELRFGEAAALARHPDGWMVRVGADVIQPRFVLLACGVGGLGERIGLGRRRDRVALCSQSWAQPVSFDTPPAGGIELHWMRGGTVGLVGLNANTCHVTLSARINRRRIETPTEHLRRLNPGSTVWNLVGCDDSSEQPAVISAWHPQRLGIDNLLAIGDAAGFGDAGMEDGIGLALTSAALATHAIHTGGATVQHYSKLMRRFHATSQRHGPFPTRLSGSSIVHHLAARWSFLPRRSLLGWLQKRYVNSA
jgi:flavin-dependent dehydrogenase